RLKPEEPRQRLRKARVQIQELTARVAKCDRHLRRLVEFHEDWAFAGDGKIGADLGSARKQLLELGKDPLDHFFWSIGVENVKSPSPHRFGYGHCRSLL